jgi:hypothetical protein
VKKYAQELADTREAEKLRRSRRNRAPVGFARCPVHGRKVGLDGEGRLLGRCDGCVTEAVQGLKRLRRMPRLRLVGLQA